MDACDRGRAVVLEWADRTRLFEGLIRAQAPAELRPLLEKVLAARVPSGSAPPALEAVPLVSCIMVTKNEFAIASHAVRDFARQTHARRELVVVLDAGSPRAELTALVAELGLRDDVVFLDAPPRSRIGALRNLAHANARGSVLCQWDDDDRHHPERLAVQLRRLVEHDAQASFLQETVNFVRGDVHWADWARGPLLCHPGTVMVRRAGAPEYAGWARLSEDAYFFCALDGRAVLVQGAPELYLYTYHGANSWDEEHHRRLARELSPPAAALAPRRAATAELARTFGLAGPLRVVGEDGLAFVLEEG